MRHNPLEYKIKINDQYSIYIKHYLTAPFYLLKVAQDNNLNNLSKKERQHLNIELLNSTLTNWDKVLALYIINAPLASTLIRKSRMYYQLKKDYLPQLLEYSYIAYSYLNYANVTPATLITNWIKWLPYFSLHRRNYFFIAHPTSHIDHLNFVQHNYQQKSKLYFVSLQELRKQFTFDLPLYPSDDYLDYLLIHTRKLKPLDIKYTRKLLKQIKKIKFEYQHASRNDLCARKVVLLEDSLIAQKQLAQKTISLSQMPDYWLLQKDRRQTLAKILVNYLPKREMEIMLLYFDEGATLRDIGASYNLSHERIRQLINKAIETLKSSSAYDQLKELYSDYILY